MRFVLLKCYVRAMKRLQNLCIPLFLAILFLFSAQSPKAHFVYRRVAFAARRIAIATRLLLFSLLNIGFDLPPKKQPGQAFPIVRCNRTASIFNTSFYKFTINKRISLSELSNRLFLFRIEANSTRIHQIQTRKADFIPN